MTIRDAIAQTDEIRPNEYMQQQKISWLAHLDMKAALTILQMDLPEAQNFAYDEKTDLDHELLIQAPFDQVYIYWLAAQIDLARAEYNYYQNDSAAFNSEIKDYTRWVARNYSPADDKPDPYHEGEFENKTIAERTEEYD